MVKAFLSSTGKDLEKYRDAAIEVCNRLQIVPIAMEFFEAMGAGASEGSKRKLDEADVYVGIFAHRYGYIEAGYDTSVTEVEFDHAGERRLDRLCFVVDPKHPWPTDAIDYENHAKLAKFKGRLDKLIRAQFDTVDSFSLKLYQSLSEWMKGRQAARVEPRDLFEPLLNDHRFFAGRAYALSSVKQFLNDPAGGYLAITAPAGFGKTAVMAKLVTGHAGSAAYHFFTSTLSESRSEEFFLRNVVQQIAAWHGDHEELPAGLNDLRRRYSELISQPLPTARALLIDGLDEVQGWSLRRYLSIPVGANVHVVATIRDRGRDWASEYGFPAVQTRHLPLSGLTRADVEAILKEAGPKTAGFAANPELLDAVMTVASYPADPGAGTDPLYLRFLIEDILENRISAATIHAQPLGMAEYLDKWWQEIRESARDAPARDLLGTLTAALGPVKRADLEAICPSLVDDWIQDFFRDVLGRMRRAVSGSDSSGYVLAHPRLKDHLQKAIKGHVYAERLLKYCERWRQTGSPYALAYFARHLAASGRASDLYTTALDADFQEKQRSAFGNIHQSLADLRLAIRTATESDDLVKTLACCGAYRRLIRAEGLAHASFSAVANGDFASALEHAASYGAGGKAIGKWHQVLRCYLAWEAAEAGDAEAQRRSLALYGRQPAPAHTDALCDVLLARAEHRLPPRPLPSPAELDEAEQRIGFMEYAIGDDPNAVSAAEYIDEERAGEYTQSMRRQLEAVAADPRGQGLIDRALNVALMNPYVRYRDNALVAIGIACAMVPDANWARQRLQTILHTALDAEGVTFTFDLPAQLDAEAVRRGVDCGNVAHYLTSALSAGDRWGTALRAHSAKASALYWQSDHVQARKEWAEASSRDQGFAGLISMHLLSLVSRCCEFGEPHLIADAHLLARSRDHAERVRDPEFRAERLRLMDAYGQWLKEPMPGFDKLESMLAEIADPDARRMLKDLTSARWAAEGRSEDLKRLIPASLSDATALDFVLARLFARSKSALPDAAIRDMLKITERDFTYSRPWAMTVPAGAPT
jgi:hypothetical protein